MGKQKQKRILFICHGNICRSVMAEYMFKEKVRQLGVEDQFEADSAATSREELGNEMYPPAKRMLTKKGIPFGHHRARQITREDYDRYDLLIGMDDWNLSNMRRMLGNDPDHKFRKMLNYIGLEREVADPWYTGDFAQTYEDLDRSLDALIREEREW